MSFKVGIADGGGAAEMGGGAAEMGGGAEAGGSICCRCTNLSSF